MYRFVPFVIRTTLALLLIAGLFVGANALYRAGLSNGYAQGLAASAQTAPGEQIAPQGAALGAPHPRGRRLSTRTVEISTPRITARSTARILAFSPSRFSGSPAWRCCCRCFSSACSDRGVAMPGASTDRTAGMARPG